jgi:tRNA wybutosine-synthesizing protein 1
MIDEKTKKILEKQHYNVVGKNSGIQICRWTKKSLMDEGRCYKEQFYGIKSHRCCQMSPCILFCQNKCLHCWRDIKLSCGKKMRLNEVDSPREIIENCIAAQRKMLTGFKSNRKINIIKYKEAQNPSQFAISLSGEPTLYPKLAELIRELRKREITSFIVTNGLNPEVLMKLQKEKSLPTQLYLSLNSPDKESYEKWHNSLEKDAWKKFNRTLRIFPKLKTRKVIRMTLVKEMNMKNENIKEYAELIKKALPDFIEVKAYMAVGTSRKRLGYDKMPWHHEIKEFSEKLAKELKSKGYKILDEKKESCVVLICKDKNKMKIKKSEI